MPNINFLMEDSEPINTGDAVSPTKPKRTRRVGEPKLHILSVNERQSGAHEEKERHGAHPSGSQKAWHPKI